MDSEQQRAIYYDTQRAMRSHYANATRVENELLEEMVSTGNVKCKVG